MKIQKIKSISSEIESLQKKIKLYESQLYFLKQISEHPIVNTKSIKEITSLLGIKKVESTLAELLNLETIIEDITDQLIHISCDYDKLVFQYQERTKFLNLF